jgi:hypothetical protein
MATCTSENNLNAGSPSRVGRPSSKPAPNSGTARSNSTNAAVNDYKNTAGPRARKS